MAQTPTKSALLASLLSAGAAALGTAKLRGGALMRHGSAGDDAVLAMLSEINFGSEDCPCIGLQGLEGIASIDMNGTLVEYPLDVGSYCAAWDDGRDKRNCLEGGEPGKGNGFCAASWCFVDACNCRNLQTPAMTRHMRSVSYQGRPLYYSYATCGSQDTWTISKNDMACVNARSEDECTALGDNCMWGETPRGKQCMAWEAGGMCMDLPEVSDWGKLKCPCVGFTGLNGTVLHDGDQYPGELGSICKTWDKEHTKECTGDDKAEGCDEPWCFVDPSHCMIDDKPQKSVWFPSATLGGRPLHYSYETCGGKRPKATTTTPTTPTTTTTTTTTAAATTTTAAIEESTTSAGEEEKEEEEEAEERGESSTTPAEDDEEDDEQPTTTKLKLRPRKQGMGFEYDHDAYGEEFGEEWHHGTVPSYRDIAQQ
mmetsp:Transcript_73717/g.213531  ORF Transcript_73717/g.213531 Transcript_73717/m.213531 type:complete len:426 (+) Transcript_73717:65-1342(+)